MALSNSSLEIVRVAVVDDSQTMRRWLTHILESDPRLKVVGQVGSSLEARELLKTTQIDVMTLDIDMPGMSGIDFLNRLMMHRPMPVVMLSALTEKGSNAAVKALSLGAVDCIEKPKSRGGPDLVRDICNRVWTAAHTDVADRQMARKTPAKVSMVQREDLWNGGVILLGASTGGVTALEAVLAALDAIPWPIVIAQHMPENFLLSFASRLSRRFTRKFYMATDGHELQTGQCVMAMGKTVSTRLVRQRTGTITCSLGTPSEEALYRPCINDLFHSAAQARLNGVAGLLTGMGADGAEGLLALKEAGFFTAAQNEATSVVYGMPKAAVEIDAAMEELSDRKMGERFASLIYNRHKYRNEMGNTT